VGIASSISFCSQDNLQRAVIKNMLKSWEREFPGRLESIFNGICNVAPSHLADRRLFDFAGLGSGYTGEQGSRPSWLLPGEDRLAGALE
jgi:tRNA 2-thiocytidine biosynthesis protein TtcA